MDLSFRLFLPQEVASVPLVRLLCTSTLRGLGVEDGCVDDIELAVSEACSNVLLHAGGEDEYEVTISVTEDTCTIEVRDKGAGPDDFAPGHDWLSSVPESGRGIHLMKSMVDELKFSSLSGGTVVTLTKTLVLRPASLLATVAHAGQSNGR